jgi:ceramide glucosyltransferase
MTRPTWQLGPLRDLLSFAVFIASHFTDAVTWRGQRFRVRRDGTLIPAKDLAS